jgi:hypothetical protein
MGLKIEARWELHATIRAINHAESNLYCSIPPRPICNVEFMTIAGGNKVCVSFSGGVTVHCGRNLVIGSYTNEAEREGTVSIVQRGSNTVEKPANNVAMFVVRGLSSPDAFSGYTDLHDSATGFVKPTRPQFQKRHPTSTSPHQYILEG